MGDTTWVGAAAVEPPTLGLEGKRFWRSVVGEWELQVDEAELLAAAARTLDVIASLDRELVDQPLMVKGSMGQMREHPLLSEARQQRAAFARLLSQLALPHQSESSVGQRSSAARAMARARWSGAGWGGTG